MKRRTVSPDSFRRQLNVVSEAQDHMHKAVNDFNLAKNEITEMAINAEFYDCFTLNMTKLARRIRNLPVTEIV